jgi:hypothetical protein
MHIQLLVAAAIAWLLCPGVLADTVTLRSGARVDGDIVVSNPDQVTLRDAKGNFRTFRRDEITKVELNDRGKKREAQKQPDSPARSAAPPEPGPDPAATPPETTEVLATGVGKDADAARKDALRQAVSQVVGTLVVANELVANDQLIDSKILTYSDGYVERYEPMGDPAIRDGLVRLKVRAWVRQGKLTKTLVENNVPVREFDLRSIQGQSETSAEQARSAEEIVKAVFTGFPTKVLKAEALQPIRIDGDDSETIVEVPLRVTVDMAKWKAWTDEVKRALDPIAEAKGTENWNVRMAGWYPMVAAKPKGKAKSLEEPDSVSEARNSPILDRFIPSADQANGVIYYGAPNPSIASKEKRVVAILDKLGGKISWWQLPDTAWATYRACRQIPTCHVRIVDDEGESIGTAVQGWTDAIKRRTPGQPDWVLDNSGKIGAPELRSWSRQAGFYNADMVCLLRVFPKSSGWTWTNDHFDQTELLADRDGFDYLRLHVPSAVGSVGAIPVGFLSPTLVYPRRFRIPGSFADIANAKVEVDFADR